MNEFNSYSRYGTIPSFEEYIERLHEKIKKDLLFLSPKHLQKWSTIIEGQFNEYNFDKELISNLCTYLEVCFMYYETLEVQYGIRGQIEKFGEIIVKLKNDIKSQMRRSAVVRKVFNYQTGKMEYELEDGNFITIDENVKAPKISVDYNVNIFPKEFIKIVNPQKYRDMKIDELL